MEQTVDNTKEQVTALPSLPFGKGVEEFRQFAYADAYLWCGKCGADIRAGGGAENIEQAFYISPMSVDSHSYMALACGNCGNKMALHFKAALNPPAEEVKEEGDTTEPDVQTPVENEVSEPEKVETETV